MTTWSRRLITERTSHPNMINYFIVLQLYWKLSSYHSIKVYVYFICLLWPSSLSPTLVEVCMTYVNMCKALDLKFSLICSAYFWGSYIESTPTWGCFHARFSTSDQWFLRKGFWKDFSLFLLFESPGQRVCIGQSVVCSNYASV